MVYPVLTLPFDIVSRIFVYCLPQRDDALPQRTEAPLLLAAICRDWRDIALCTHELWNTMHLDLLRPHSVLKVTPLLDFWIPRAGNLPLSMSLLYKGGNSETSTEAVTALVRQYACHWGTLELHIPLAALLPLNNGTKDFTLLKKLVLNCESEFLIRKKRVVRAFTRAPKLQELHILSGSGPISPANIALPWGQLATLRLDNSTVAGCLEVLAHVPNITNLTCILWTFGGTPSGPILCLPHLRSLRLLLSHTRGSALLNRLQLPALEHLELDLPSAPQLEAVLQLIAQSACLIRWLSVKLGSSWTPADFLRFLGVLDSLEELVVRNGANSIDAVFHLLTANPFLLPKLSSLQVERTAIDFDDVAAVVADLLERRWNIPANVSFPARLESFRLTSPRVPPPDLGSDAMSRVNCLRSAGMSIQMTFCGYGSDYRYMFPETVMRLLMAQCYQTTQTNRVEERARTPRV